MREFRALYKAGRVTRYHTADVRAQSLAAHSWGVAMIVNMIYPNQKPPAHVIMAALTHDLAELATGDIPATAKWDSPELSKVLRQRELSFNLEHNIEFFLTPKEVDILAWADTFELCLYCTYQANKGDQYARQVADRGMAHLLDMGFPTTESRTLYDEIFGS